MARLESIPAVTAAYVEITGRHFLLIVGTRISAPEATAEALRVLGADSCQLEIPWDEEEISGIGKGELWLTSGNLVSLSLLEARILADRWGRCAAREAKLDHTAEIHFGVILRSELARVFFRVHEEGGVTEPAWYLRAFPAALDRCIARMDQIAVPDQIRVLRDSLFRSLSA